MPIHKRKKRNKVDWYFKFDLPGASRDNRRIIRGFGYLTRQEAIAAEANRRTDERQKSEMAKAGADVDREVPKTLAILLDEFFSHHACENLAPKTVERYRDAATYISPELLAKPLGEITALHLNREWSRLLKSGGHLRKSTTQRPLSAKSVRNIAGVISSAFSRAIKWGLTTTNPVTNSEPPKVKRHHGIAFTPAVQRTVIDSADRKSTRLNASHAEIYTLSLHDALPIWAHHHQSGHQLRSAQGEKASRHRVHAGGAKNGDRRGYVTVVPADILGDGRGHGLPPRRDARATLGRHRRRPGYGRTVPFADAKYARI